MPTDLLSRARQEAECSGHSLRLAALLRIAYAESTSDALRARLTLTHSLDECRYVPRGERQYLLEDARIVAAAIAPEIVNAISLDRQDPIRSFNSGGVLRTMIEHGHSDAAFEFVLQADPLCYPFNYIGPLLRKLDGPQRLELLRSAVDAWRQSRDQDFVWVLRFFWKDLPAAEALSVARDIVEFALTTEDLPMSGGVHEICFTSSRQYTFFELLPVLRKLDPALAKKLIARHDELAAAAQRFPNGFETLEAEADTERKKHTPVESGCGGGLMMGGSVRDFAYQTALLEARRTRNFAPALKYARDEYNEDTSPERPNYAPKYRWPSAWRYRTVLYYAALTVGEPGVVYLDCVPDEDLRLLSLIEFATALAALPQLSGVQNRQPYPPGKPLFRGGRVASIPPMPSRAFPGESMRSPDGTLIRCPKCDWLPPAATRWSCGCGHTWNTFWTCGRCPACKHEWQITQCLHCGEVSAHRSWYVHE